MSDTPITVPPSAPSNGHQSSLERFSVRRTESIDAPQIMKLIERSTEKIFGKMNIVNIIEKAVLSITLTGENGEVLGFGAFYDSPIHKAYDSKTWESSLPEKYGLNSVTSLNTLFLQYFVAKRPYQHDIAQEILRTVFSACIYVHNIFLLSGTAHIGTALSESFGRLREGPKEEKLFRCERHSHVPQLHIRTARPEDNDDLTPLFTQQNAVLRQAYGDYFVAELIEAQDENHRALVAEVGGLAVGFMCVSTEVDVGLLNKCFELKPYNFLHAVKKAEDGDSSVGTDSNVDPAEAARELEEVVEVVEEGGDGATSTAPPPSVAESVKSGAIEEAAKGESSAMDGSRSVSIPPSRVSETQSEDVSEKPKTAGVEDGGAVSEVPTAEPPVAVAEEVPEIVVEEKIELGEPSAFCIQLFCIDERYETRSIDFMTEAFKLFPDKDYCVITIPHTISEFPLLQSFSRCTPRPTSTLEQELYLFHRGSLLQNIRVRFGTEEDGQGIQYITRKYRGKSTVMKDYTQYLKAYRDDNGTPLYSMIMECGGQIIGVAVIRAEMDTEYLRSHYSLEDFIYFTQHLPTEHGHLFHCVVTATFSTYTKFFLRECLRLCSMSCLYYTVRPDGSDGHSTVEALHHLVQIRPRRQIIYPVESMKGSPPATYNNVPVENVLKSLPPAALFHINKKLTLEPKMIVNSRLVVVGASDVSLRFLETLVACPHIHFNNLVLISPEGLPTTSPPSLPQSLECTPDRMARISLSTSCNIVQAKMKSINRLEQYVEVDDGRKVQYDCLVLGTGAQFSIPIPPNVDTTRKPSLSTPIQRDVSEVSRIAPYRPPAQVVTLDSLSSATNIVQTVKENGGSVVIYGSSLTTYTTVHALLEGGITEITHVQPATPVSCFNNKTILGIVESEMESAGVKIVRETLLHGYVAGEAGQLLGVEVAPVKGGTVETLECGTCITLQDKGIDRETFESINNCCLVFDGRLVIDTNCRTNDPLIYGAGPLTKYKRALYCDDHVHEVYSSGEVAERLAQIILPLFDPSFPTPTPVETYEIPKLVKPKTVFAVLPGGYHYLHVARPQPLVDLETAMLDPNYGRELVTGDKDSGYFRLHLNQYHSVETITCLAKSEFDVSNICQLYGLHQQFMNSLEDRFDSGLISDFFAYFKEPWSLLLYHDRFPELRAEIMELLCQPNQPGEQSISEKVCQMIDEDLTVEEKTKTALLQEYSTSLAKTAVENRLFSYLSYNKYHLPHYAGQNMA